MRTPEELLEHHAAVAGLLEHARLLARLGRGFAATCPGGLAEWARVVNYRQGTVVIHAENGAVAAKLRQLAPRLRDAFVKIGLECNGLEVKVQPVQNIAQSMPSTIKPISHGGLAALSGCAAGLPAASPLAAALRRLVAHAAKTE
jgi:hypothetical protein